MLANQLKTTIQEAYRQWLKNLDGKVRPTQKMMIAEIANWLAAIPLKPAQSDASVLAIEAGTGTGKTLAYLLATIPIAQQQNKSIVVSTATIALQEQLINKDLPELEKSAGLQFDAVLAKGRGRYLCLLRLDQALSGDQQNELFLEGSKPSDDKHLAKQFADGISTGRWDGDIDNWGEELESRQWSAFTSDQHQCTGRHCSFVSQCCFFKAREGLAKADVIIANHDLVLSDLALGGGVILSEPEETIYIFDEAHHLGDKSLKHFSLSVTVSGLHRFVDQTTRLMQQIQSSLALLSEIPELAQDVKSYVTQATNLHRELEVLTEPYLEQISTSRERNPYLRFPNGELPKAWLDFSSQAQTFFSIIQGKLASLYQDIQRVVDSNNSPVPREELEASFASVGVVKARAESQGQLWRNYASGELPMARWISLSDSSEIWIHASPVNSVDVLRQHLWSRAYAVLLTSATLSSLGNFERLRLSLGFPEQSQCLRLLSPFNYSAAIFSVPKDAVDASKVQLHTDYLVNSMPEWLSYCKASLVLFSSRQQMWDVFEALELDIQKRILMQGSQSRQKILEMHFEEVDKEKTSVLFGLASFSEGLDLPGKYCEQVIIAKLPFSPPAEPTAEALAEWLEQQGRNPFYEISLPDASMRLIQSSGRLLRSETDGGRVILADKRFVSKSYGRQLVQSLPPYCFDYT